MDVFNCKRNKFVQTVLCSKCLNEFWLYWILGSTKMHSMEATSMLLQFPRQAYQLHCPSLFFIVLLHCLLINECLPKPGDNSCCDTAYRRLLFYPRLAHEPAYTCNTDDRSVEPHYFMFLQGSLTFSIHHLSNLMHHYIIRTYVFVTNKTFSHALIHR